MDADRDGVADIVVGAPEANAGRGAVLVWRGQDQPARDPVVTIEPAEPQTQRFGEQVSATGDFDGDGFADGAMLSAFRGEADARVMVYRLNLDEAITAPLSTLRGAAAGISVTSVLRSVGDVNGDGYGDLAVGLPSSNDARGEVRVFLGSASGLAAERLVAVRAEVSAQTRFGVGIVPIGDSDGDGFDDLVVTADQSRMEAGRAFLVRGRSNFVTQQVVPLELSLGAATATGQRGSVIGDINRDGTVDLALAGTSGAGLLFAARREGLPVPLVLDSSSTGCMKLGAEYAGGFDHNGDRLVDFAVVCEVSPSRVDVLLLTGPALPPTRLPSTLSPQDAGGRFAAQIAAYGDFNADGLGDLVTTTPARDATPTILAVHWGTSGAASGAPFSLRLPAGVGVNDPLVLSR